MSVKISNFINDPWRAIAMDAERRGSEITSKNRNPSRRHRDDTDRPVRRDP